jgi:hypothetical protein
VYLDASMQAVETGEIQQVSDRAFWKRGERWIDGQSVLNQRLEPDERIERGSSRCVELQRELEAQGRGAVLSLRGEVLLEIAGRNVLVTWPAAGRPEPQTTHMQEIR